MLWLQLKKNGLYHTLDLSEDVSIPYEIPCDLLSLEFQEVERTYPFELPASPANEVFFGPISSLSRSEYFFQEYEAILGYGPNVLKKGYFKLSDPSEVYQGFLKGPESALSKVKDSLLGDLLPGVMIRVFYREKYLDRHDERGPVVFPTLLFPNFYGKKGSGEDTEPIPNFEEPMDDVGFFNYFQYLPAKYYGRNVLPTPRLLFVLEEVLRAVGFEPQFNFRIKDLYQVLLLCHGAADNPFKVYAEPAADDRFYQDIFFSETLPHITVSDFFRSLRINFGMKFTYRPNGVCEVDLIRDLVKSRKYLDITKYVVPGWKRQEYKADLRFSFAQKEAASQESAQELARMVEGQPVLFLENLPIPGVDLKDQYRLVLTENRYYAPVFEENTWAWKPTEQRYFDGLDGGTGLESKITPADMDNVAEVTFDTTGVWDELSNGWILDPLFQDSNFMSVGYDEGKIIWPGAFESDYSPFVYSRNNSMVVLNAKKDGVLVLAPGEPVNIRVTVRKKFPFYVPVLEEGGSSNFFAVRNNDFKARMALYHGYTPRTNQKGSTKMASSSNYDSLGNKVSPFSLRFNGDDGLVSYFWEEALEVMGTSEIDKVAALLPLSFLQGFDPRVKLRIKNTTFLPTLLRCSLTNDGLQLANLEMRQLRHNGVMMGVEIQEEGGWVDYDGAIVSDGDEAMILT
ncbi:hypothetical protein [Rufibacter soli]